MNAAASRRLLRLTPYFVPGDAGIALLEALRGRGVALTLITNSLASSKHPYVHGAYSKARDRLMAAGVTFYEAKAGSVPGGLTLHTKAAIIDREPVLVGTLNLDPRSFYLNTELEREIRQDLPGHVYALRSSRAGGSPGSPRTGPRPGSGTRTPVRASRSGSSRRSPASCRSRAR